MTYHISEDLNNEYEQGLDAYFDLLSQLLELSKLKSTKTKCAELKKELDNISESNRLIDVRVQLMMKAQDKLYRERNERKWFTL